MKKERVQGYNRYQNLLRIRTFLVIAALVLGVSAIGVMSVGLISLSGCGSGGGSGDGVVTTTDAAVPAAAAASAAATAEVTTDVTTPTEIIDAADILGDNISGTPEMASAKAKMNTMTIYVPTQDNEGTLSATESKSKPIIITYTDEIPGTGGADVFAAISRDDGVTWKLSNLSNSANLSSFTLQDGTSYPGDCRKPVMAVKGNMIFVAWTSKYAPGIITQNIGEDLYGVAGEQRSIDYTFAYKGEFAWAGEIPYSAVWTVRGLVDKATGNIDWQPAQQLTSAIRDALQIFVGGVPGVGFALTWQEDPDGLLPGSGDGPGHGWSGAIANHTTDIWYSYIPWAAVGDSTKSLMMPVRISDNDMCRPAQEAAINEDPFYALTHTYCADICFATTTIINEQGEVKEVCVTEDGRVLDGRSAGTRPNIFLQPYTDTEGIKKSWVILGYEETNGFSEPGVFDEGKNVIFHSFDMTQPNTVSDGTIVNLNEVEADGTVTDLYENARRPRFIIQPAGKMAAARVPLVVIYKQGKFGTGSPSDIFLRRFVVPADADLSIDNPYRPENLQEGALNMSSFTPSGDFYIDQQNPEDGIKVPGMIQTEANLLDQSYANMFSEARAHRGQIRGDYITLGYTQTINWQAALNGRDKYDFFVRRSFDGGATWTDVANVFEAARNLSNLPDNTYSVIEPRLVATPSSIVCTNPEGVTSPCTPEDKQDIDTYMVAYGTALNTVDGGPADLFYARTIDFGESYELIALSDLLPPLFNILANGDSEQGEVQIRLTPDGNKFYSSWLGEKEVATLALDEGSDIRFRRIDY